MTSIGQEAYMIEPYFLRTNIGQHMAKGNFMFYMLIGDTMSHVQPYF
jgi:hypothetical protein